ncbi:MAG: nuclear transport factor 2 family protein [Nitrospinales bacterium]
MANGISENLKTVFEILIDEIKGDVKSALSKMTDDYSMTWMHENKNGDIFPQTRNNIKSELEQVYHIKGREYDIKNIAEGDNLIMLEMIESYPDTKTNKVYRTPQVIVLEMRDGKIRTGRHYNDPKLSYLHLSKNQIEKAYINSKGSIKKLN